MVSVLRWLIPQRTRSREPSRSIVSVPDTSLTDRSVAIDAALAGADVVRAAFGRPVTEELKGAVDPVSKVDLAAEAAVLGVLRRHRPNDDILAEESGGSWIASGRRWIVDPLDGTVNFLHAIPHVGVSVALWDGDAPVACATIDVLRDEVFSAAAGAGAELNGSTVRVSDRERLSDCVVGTGFPYDRDVHGAAYAETVGAVLPHVRGVRRLGAAVLDFAWVACGRLDGFWEFHLSPWDVAAGLLLVHEAGGHSADVFSSPASVDSSAFILSNAALETSFIDLVREAVPEHVRPTN